jgi:hypothetical protein
MPAYARYTLKELIALEPRLLVGQLEMAYAHDGYASQLQQQTLAWRKLISILQADFRTLLNHRSDVAEWVVLLEYPLYRLGRRIDLIVLTGRAVLIVELKVGEKQFRAADRRQVEEYALDLHDFHAESSHRILHPILWCTAAANNPYRSPYQGLAPGQVAPVTEIGAEGLMQFLLKLPASTAEEVDAVEWNNSPYRPVPNVIQAATRIFAGHDVRAIAQADASNLNETAGRVIELLKEAKNAGRYAVIFVTGVPGSGKTLAGLQIAHDVVATGTEARGDIIYLSGNMPLVTVLREALARAEYLREKSKDSSIQLSKLRQKLRARIQHINDFLKESYKHSADKPPHEHAIIFDEAQRAWDEEQGKKKFDRAASEPTLLLEVMSRHPDWCACICLIGGGQEINSGEHGIRGWGDALRQIAPESAPRWIVHGPPEIIEGGSASGGLRLGPIQSAIQINTDPTLGLEVPLRSYRTPLLAGWVDAVIEGNASKACALKARMGAYPILLTRSLSALKLGLRHLTRGERRYGLLASSGARRLRAEGVGVILHANDRDAIAHWYLNPRDDVRSSYALEVPANEYTSQGLELDFVGLCWDSDFTRDVQGKTWVCRRFSGNKWQTVANPDGQRFIKNSYRVLLTRSREGIIIWIPKGNEEDSTRNPILYDRTASFLLDSGAQLLPTYDQPLEI